jgi:hypothetical protein
MAKRARDPVQFTLESAERIASVVREAETAPPAAFPLTFAKRFAENAPRQVRAATFSGAWPIGSAKTVTFKYAPTATASVTNLSWPITSSGYTAENCIVGKDGTNWWLVVPVLEARTSFFVAQTASRTYCDGASRQNVVSDVSISATLNTNNCSITIGKTVTTATVNVVTTTATAIFLLDGYTSSFLRVRVP